MYIWYLFWSIFFQFFYHHSFLLRFLNSSGTQNFENFLTKFFIEIVCFWTISKWNFLKFLFFWFHWSTVWGCFINRPQKYPHFEKYPFFVAQRSYRFPHRNHYGHHFNHASNQSHEQKFLFENRAVEADVPHNAGRGQRK